MKPLMRLVPCVVAVAFALSALAAHAQTANPAVVAVPRQPWIDKHNGFNAVAKNGGIDVVFLGDSITEGWHHAGKEIWTRRYAPLKAANFGISGDSTEHLLWRLQNGNFDGITPKAVVLMIGTNNIGRDSAQQIAQGITAIVKAIQERTPSTKILLLAVFPRNEKADDPARLKIGELNEIIAKLDDGKTVFFMDIGPNFLQPDGTLTREIMPDLLHLSPASYQIWANAIQAKLAELLK
jgi:lysophospholipase L1-like esterase